MNAPANPFVVANSAGGQVAHTTASGDSDQQRAIAEVQAAMMIARMNPRDAVASMDRILIHCARPSLAEAATYTYARGGQTINGPTIRLAETMAQAWGNMQYGIRELEQRNGESTVEAFAWDVETNTRRETKFQVKHERHTRAGTKKLTDPRDIYELTANMGARRLRSCILAIIPGDVTEAAVLHCESTLQSTIEVTPDLIKQLLERFEEHGIAREQIEERIQRRVESILPAHVIALRKIYNSLRDGMSTPSTWFDVPEPQSGAGAAINEQIEKDLIKNGPKPKPVKKTKDENGVSK